MSDQPTPAPTLAGTAAETLAEVLRLRQASRLPDLGAQTAVTGTAQPLEGPPPPGRPAQPNQLTDFVRDRRPL